MGIWQVRSLIGTWPLEDGVRYLIIGTDINLIDYGIHKYTEDAG
jgi:hypothetical protein